MHNGREKSPDLLPYTAPDLRQIDPHEVIRKLMAELTGPLGKTREERLKNAASAIQNVLERLPAEERDDAAFAAVGDDGRWVLQSAWMVDLQRR